MKPFGQHPDDKELPKTVAALLERVDRDSGRVLAVYREPVGNHWQAFCLLPLLSVAPTPYQRDLSPTHAKRLTDVVRKIDRFVYEENKRFAGGVFAPILKRVDKFLKGRLPDTLEERQDLAAVFAAPTGE
jgi:hypothetical protein